MPFKFGETSLSKINTVHPILALITHNVLLYMNIGVSCGNRDASEQNAAYMRGMSKLEYPKSKHNKSALLNGDKSKSDAIDLLVYVDNKATSDMKYYILLNGYMQAFALITRIDLLGLQLRWGGNWDGDEEIITDQRFNDLCHFELIKKEGK
jgi:peptidoglycan LD-endopeptidase CwlK